MLDQNQEPNEGKISEEQTNKPNEEQIAEEKLNAPKEEPNQPLENSDDFLPDESSESPVSASSSQKRLIIIIAIVLGVMLISGGLLFAAGRFFDIEIPFISKLFKKGVSGNTAVQTIAEESPEEVIKKMFSNFKNIKTSQETFDLKITEENKDGEDKVSNILLGGKRDLNIKENPKFDYVFTINQPDSKVDISLAFRYIDEIVNIKLMEDSQIPFFDLSQLQNQWFYFEKQERENLKDVVADTGQTQSKLNKGYKEKIFEIFKEAKLFKTIQPFQCDAIDSVPVFHYWVTLDAQGFFELMTKLEEVGQNMFRDQNLPVAFPKERIDEMRKSLEKIKDIPIEVWIEKESYFLRKVLINHFVADITKSDVISKVDVLLTFELNKINEPVDIRTHRNGESLEPVIQNIFGKWFSQSPLSKNGSNELEAVDESDDDKDGLTNQEEFFYNTDPQNSDTDGDGYLDGDEIKNGYNPNGV